MARDEEQEGFCNPALGPCAAEISHDHWSRFLDNFSKQHQGEDAQVEVTGTDSGGSQRLVRRMPLVGVTYSNKDRPDLIEIILEQAPDGANLTHVIERPAHVWHEADGGQFRLQIEASDGSTTLLQVSET